jgi:hypothetical protein
MAESMQFLASDSLRPDDFSGDMQTSSKSSSTTNNNNKQAKKPRQDAELNLNQMSPINSSDPSMISTLDEPVRETIMRDVKAVAYKFGHVFFPKQSTTLLKDWDLWGPLFLCVLLSISLQSGRGADANSGPQFANVFALIALGAIVITINTKLLSGKISFFQSICVLGYCLLPLVGVSLVNNFIVLTIKSSSFVLFITRCTLVFVSFAWSVFASTAFLESNTINLNDRKALALYPIFLFYFVIAWLIILHVN